MVKGRPKTEEKNGDWRLCFEVMRRRVEVEEMRGEVKSADMNGRQRVVKRMRMRLGLRL